MNSETNKFYSPDESPSNTDPNATVEDKEKIGRTDISIGGGLEMRKGKGRLQGLYGAEANIFFSGGKNKYTYGNAFSEDNTNPESHDFGDNIFYNPRKINTPERLTEIKNGTTLGIGIRAFIGAEYFILPKLSIGGEFGWGLDFASTGDDEGILEEWDGANNKVKTTTIKTANGSYFGIDTDNLGGFMYIMLHF
jgi:hypothetical protein